MIEIIGKYTKAIIYANQINQEVYSQIQSLTNNSCFKNKKIRIMPDCHLGKGSVVGFTAELGNRISPNVIGVK